MPLYEYACSSCGSHFEVRQRIVEEPISVCPSCGGPTRRILQPVGIIFKGSGWYVTDSRKSDQATASSETSSRAETTGDGKPATPSGSTPASSDRSASTTSSTS